jgi:GTP cyclohydrolase II
MPTRDEDSPPSAMTEAAALPTKYGAFRVFAYVDEEELEHLALVHGDVSTAAAPIVRVHSECLTGDALASLRCDCGDQLNAAMKRIEDEGSGVLLYLRQEGRGIGLANKIRAYTLQDQGLDTVEANQCLGFEPDERNYDVAVSMLGELGVSRIRLLTNNPAKISSLERGGVEVEARLALTISRDENRNYLQTKAEKLQHLL